MNKIIPSNAVWPFLCMLSIITLNYIVPLGGQDTLLLRQICFICLPSISSICIAVYIKNILHSHIFSLSEPAATVLKVQIFLLLAMAGAFFILTSSTLVLGNKSQMSGMVETFVATPVLFFLMATSLCLLYILCKKYHTFHISMLGPALLPSAYGLFSLDGTLIIFFAFVLYFWFVEWASNYR
jgi:hypothetical protein